ncbi:MAG: Flp family type IVb pilin, partial [Novosphingobium sp.]
IEYGLIAALIAVAIMTTVGGLGSQLNSTFSKTSSSMSAGNAA